MIPLLLLALQAQVAAPTVGDTVWVARTIFVPAGAIVRPTPWPDEAGAPVQPLGPPVLERHGDSLLIRYPLVAWTPGEHPLEIPGPVLLGPGAAMDSLASEPTTLVIESVIPDSVDIDHAPPQPAALTVGDVETSWFVPVEFGVLGAAIGAGAVLFRRRKGRLVESPASPRAPDPDVVRWANDGGLRAAQAGARDRLRRAIARAVPAAAERFDVDRCMAQLRLARPDWPLLELEGLLLALDAERFAPGQGDPDLVQQADALRARLERVG